MKLLLCALLAVVLVSCGQTVDTRSLNNRLVHEIYAGVNNPTGYVVDRTKHELDVYDFGQVIKVPLAEGDGMVIDANGNAIVADGHMGVGIYSGGRLSYFKHPDGPRAVRDIASHNGHIYMTEDGYPNTSSELVISGQSSAVTIPIDHSPRGVTVNSKGVVVVLTDGNADRWPPSIGCGAVNEAYEFIPHGSTYIKKKLVSIIQHTQNAIGVAFDAQDNLYVSDACIGTLGKYSPTFVFETFVQSRLNHPFYITSGPNGITVPQVGNTFNGIVTTYPSNSFNISAEGPVSGYIF